MAVRASYGGGSTLRGGVVSVGFSIVGDPSVHLDEIGDEAGYQTFQDARVAAKDEFVYHTGLVELFHH